MPVIGRRALPNTWKPKETGIDARTPPKGAVRAGYPLLFLLQRETAQLNARLRYRWLPKITQAAQPRSFPNRKPAMRAPAPWRYRGRANLSMRRFYIAGRTLSLLNRGFIFTIQTRITRG